MKHQRVKFWSLKTNLKASSRIKNNNKGKAMCGEKISEEKK